MTVTFANNTTGVITAKTLTVSGYTASNKTYDGTTTAAVTGGTLSGVVGGDTVTVGTYTAAFSATKTPLPARPSPSPALPLADRRR